VFTSYFAVSGRDPNAVSIAVSSPFWFKGKKYSPLMPTWELVDGHKFGRLSEGDYRFQYFRLLQMRGITPEKVLEDLREEALLLCWERPGEFCHRRLVAEWMAEKGIEVPELVK